MTIGKIYRKTEKYSWKNCVFVLAILFGVGLIFSLTQFLFFI